MELTNYSVLPLLTSNDVNEYPNGTTSMRSCGQYKKRP